MIKSLLPLSVYTVGIIILLILYPNYNTSGKDFFQTIPFLMFWLTTILIVISLIITVIHFIKKNILSGFLYLISAISIYTIYKKLLFVDFNTFIHLFFIIALLTLVIVYRKKISQRIIFSVFLLMNLITLFVSDQFLLLYFNSTKIPWTESGIKWKDFSDSFSNHLNESHYDSNGNKIDPNIIRGITTNSIKYKVNTSGSIPSVVVVAFFIPNESYMKKEFKTSKQLNHENGYVDICEYHARLIRKVFNYKTTGMVNYKVLFKKYDFLYFDGFLTDVGNAEIFIERMIDRKEDMNEQYMLETEFGTNFKEQKKWDIRIQKLLTELKEYK